MKFIFVSLLILIFSVGCGRGPSPLLRVGATPINDFPMYVSAADGNIYKFESDGSRSVFISGLSTPWGVATDKFNHLYVVESGNSRLLKINISSLEQTVVISGLSSPTAVAIDSFGEAYVTQEGAKNIIRASDGKIVSSYSNAATAIAFGVNDLMLVGVYDSNVVYWGSDTSAPSTTFTQPAMIATDGNGRVFVAEGSVSNAKVYRFHQRDPSGQTVVADGLNGATGIVVDSVGNIYIAEPGNSRIVLVTFSQQLYNWAGNIQANYMAFTQY